MVNRCVVTVRAREPFLRWLRSVSGDATTTLNEINDDTSAYLLPDYWDDDEQQLLLARYYDLIFENELAGWWTDESDWPERRDLAMFMRWFDAEFHSVVTDLVADDLRDEE